MAIEGRPCRYCRARSEFADAEDCGFAHRDEQRVYDLALALAKVFQDRTPSDEQIAYFLEDANAIVDGFNPVPDRWRVRRLPDSDEFVCRLRVNDVSYVIPDGDGFNAAVRLSTYRAAQVG